MGVVKGNLERFFGCRVEILDSLDPVRIGVLQEKAAWIVAREDFDPEQYHLYFHQLNLVPNPAHFAHGLGVDQRIDELSLSFEVNPKQIKRHTIRFYNYLFDAELPKEISVSRSETSLHYFIKGAYLKDHLDFRNELITFVSKDVKPQHRKIKVSVTVKPTELFTKKLRTRKETVTRMDLRFERYTPIKIPPATLAVADAEKHEEKRRMDRAIEKTETMKKHVFLSYCRDDKDDVARLRTELLKAGESVWWDQDIDGGQDWKFEIRKAMKSACAVVLCLSAKTAARKTSGIYPETLDAINLYREHAPGDVFLIPVRLSDTEIPPIEIDGIRTLDRLQFVDLFPAKEYAKGIEKLLRAIRKADGHP